MGQDRRTKGERIRPERAPRHRSRSQTMSDTPSVIQRDATAQPAIGPERAAMYGSEVVLQPLVEPGAEVVFAYPGGAVLPIYDAIFKQDKIRHILVRHEQGAVHMAEGYARATGRVGVVLVTSGPGATNAVTGIANAYMDSTPIVVITGQVPKHLIGTDAFQEVDTVGITRPCVKHNYLVREARDLPAIVREAFHLARSGRPGPVVIDIPKDVTAARANYSRLDHVTFPFSAKPAPVDQKSAQLAVEHILRAKRPV